MTSLANEIKNNKITGTRVYHHAKPSNPNPSICRKKIPIPNPNPNLRNPNSQILFQAKKSKLLFLAKNPKQLNFNMYEYQTHMSTDVNPRQMHRVYPVRSDQGQHPRHSHNCNVPQIQPPDV